MDIVEKITTNFLFGKENVIHGSIYRVVIEKDGKSSSLHFTSSFAITRNSYNTDYGYNLEKKCDISVTGEPAKIWKHECKNTSQDKSICIVSSAVKKIAIDQKDKDKGITFTITISNVNVVNSPEKTSKQYSNIRKKNTIHTVMHTTETKIIAKEDFFIYVLWTGNANIPIVKVAYENRFMHNVLINEDWLIYNSMKANVDVETKETINTSTLVPEVAQADIVKQIEDTKSAYDNEAIEYNDKGEVIKYYNRKSGIKYTMIEKADKITNTWYLDDVVIDHYTSYHDYDKVANIHDKANAVISSGNEQINIDFVSGSIVGTDNNIDELEDRFKLELNVPDKVDQNGTYIWPDGSKTIISSDVKNGNSSRTDIIDDIVIISNKIGQNSDNTITKNDQLILNSHTKTDYSLIGTDTHTVYADNSGINYTLDMTKYNNIENIIKFYHDNYLSFSTDVITGSMNTFSSYIYDKDKAIENGVYVRDDYGVPHLYKLPNK